jgi:hypothetical protein
MVAWAGIGQLARFKGEGIAVGLGAGGDYGVHWGVSYLHQPRP